MLDQALTHDWDDYTFWHDQTNYATTLVVDQKHPAAADSNPGTEAAPFRTINAAAQVAQPGTRVLIRGGLYRETVRPLHGGTAPDAMISYEAAYGEQVIVSGGQPLIAQWSRPRYWGETMKGSPLTASYSHRAWHVTLDDSLFPAGYRPFALPNVTAAEETLMNWMEPVSGQVPYSLRRGMLFQDGQRLTQLAHAADVPRVPGSFWVDQDDLTLHVHPFGSVNPNKCAWEVATAEHVFRPQSVGLNYIRVAGLTFQYCANGFLRAATGAVTSLGGAYWIFENNTIRQMNSSGLEFGNNAFEYKDPHPDNIREKRALVGHVIARNNAISDCGTAGIRSLNVTEGRVVDNTIYRCGWQEAEYYFECAGIKLLVNNHTLVARNHIFEMRAACGIWMDWSNQWSRVTQNLIYDVEAQQGGIFIEASRVPNLIDRNIIWDIDGDGIFGGEAENQLFVHNMIGRVRESAFQLIRHTDRDLNGSELLCENNLVQSNIIVDPNDSEVTEDRQEINHNCYIITAEPSPWDQQTWQERGFDRDSSIVPGAVDWNPEALIFSFDLTEQMPQLPVVQGVRHDWFGATFEAGAASFGPFTHPGKTSDLVAVVR